MMMTERWHPGAGLGCGGIKGGTLGHLRRGVIAMEVAQSGE
jgi:hypothetical protein